MLSFSYQKYFKIFIVVISIYIASQITAVYLPLILSLIFSFILNPLVDFIEKIKLFGTQTVPRSVAVLLSFLCAIGLMGIVIYVVLVPFVKEFDKFIIDFPALISKIEYIRLTLEKRTTSVVLPANVTSIIEQLLASIATFSIDLTKRIMQAIFNITSQIVELVVVPVLTYYFLKDWRVMKEKIIRICSPAWHNKVRCIIDDIAAVVSSYIRGQVLVSAAMGLMVFCGMYFLKIDYPLVLGLLAAITETIPIIGPIIGAVPSIILAYLILPELALKVVLFFIIIHQIENHILVPNIMGHTIALHPAVIIISLLVGAQLWGIIGMILAVPLAAIIRVLLKYLWE